MDEYPEGPPCQVLSCLAFCHSQSNLVPGAELWVLRADENRKEDSPAPAMGTWYRWVALPWSEQEVPRRVTGNRARLCDPPHHTLAYERKENYCPLNENNPSSCLSLGLCPHPSLASNPGARQPFFQKLFLSMTAKVAQRAWAKTVQEILTVTDVRLVVVFLRGGVMPPPATCRATSLRRH